MDQQELESKRREVRKDILTLEEKTMPALILNMLRYVSPKFKPTQSPLFWILNIAFINSIMFIPGFIISVLWDEVKITNQIGLIWIVGVELSLCALLATYVVVKNVLSEISSGIVGKINNLDDVSEFISWLNSSWSPKIVLSYVFPIWFTWVFLSIWGVSYSWGHFVGFGPAYITIPTGFIMGTSCYVVLWIMRLSLHLGNYQYDLNKFTPASSEIVERLSKMFNDYLYTTAIFIAASTLLSSFLRFANVVGYPFVLAGWTMITIQFIINRSTVGKIVNRAKWETLNKLQLQINELQVTGNLAEKETLEALLRLADLHQKILVTRSTASESKGFLNFFSQMMLPLLGLLLGNLDKLLKLLP